MKKAILFILLAALLIPFSFLNAQSTYTLADYAASGDTVYLTKAQIVLTNFDTTGAGITWNYTSLTGNGQTILAFRAPNQSGFTAFQWPYIYNQNNVNLSSTDGQTISIGNYEETNPNDYYLKSQNTLQQKASSFDVVIGGFSFSIKNTYTSPDYIYRFPLNYGNTDTSSAAYSTDIPGVYYSQTQVKRMDTVNGWGTLITPSDTFTNALKLESIVSERDSVVFNDTFSQVLNTVSREFQWLDPSKTYPVLDVKQLLTGNIYVTESIQYFDRRQYYQPLAHFVYLPLLPVANDTVSFQNLSTNSYNFSWNFGDTLSGVNDTSNATNPIHIFNSPGIYKVTLIATNGPLRDTTSENITVADSGTVPPVAHFTYSPPQPYPGDTVLFQNLSANGATYLWNFGDVASSVNDTSSAANPFHIYSSTGSYNVTLIAFDGLLSDTASLSVTVTDTAMATPVTAVPVNTFSLYPNPANGFIRINTDSNEPYDITIFDLQGRQLLYEVGRNGLHTVDLSFFDAGMYAVRLQAGGEVHNVRLLVDGR